MQNIEKIKQGLAMKIVTQNMLELQSPHTQQLINETIETKSDFCTAWDFAGQNYLNCFHSIFLSSRFIYLHIIDLTIKNLNSGILIRDRDDRPAQRSNLGIPKIYLEVYEFWLNAIYSVSKTISTDQHYNCIVVFSKAGEVDNPMQIANRHMKTLKYHMQCKNRACNLVHEKKELILLSCKTNSHYLKNVSKLNPIIKKLSDQVVIKRPIPIR